MRGSGKSAFWIQRLSLRFSESRARVLSKSMFKSEIRAILTRFRLLSRTSKGFMFSNFPRFLSIFFEGVQKSTFPKPSQIDAQGPVSSLRGRIKGVGAQRPRFDPVFQLFGFLFFYLLIFWFFIYLFLFVFRGRIPWTIRIRIRF